MKYLVTRSLYNTRRENHNAQTTARKVLEPKLRRIRLSEIDPHRKLIDEVVVGCSATYPFYLVTVHIPRNKSDPIYSDDSNADGACTRIGAVSLWTIQACSIDYMVPRIRSFQSGQFSRLSVLSMFSAWYLPKNYLLQVLLRCEERPKENSGSDKPATGCGCTYDRELIEFRQGPFRHLVIGAGTGEFDGNHNDANFDLFSRFGLIAVSLNSRIFLYGQHTQSGTAEKYWRDVPACEVEFSHDNAHKVAVVELDFFVSDMYPRKLVFVGQTRASTAVRFDEFATRSLRPANNGYTVIFGALDKLHGVFLACALLLDVVDTKIVVQSLYRSDVSNLRSIGREYNVQSMLDLVVKSQKFVRERSPILPQPNIKKLEVYRDREKSVETIELKELDLALISD